MKSKRRLTIVVCAVLTSLSIVSPVLLRSQNFTQPSPEHVLGQEVVAGEVLVRFRDDAYRRLSQIARDLDVDNIRPLGDGAWRRIHSASRSAQALLTALAARADVLEVEPNYIVHSTAIPNDPLFPQLWGL